MYEDFCLQIIKKWYYKNRASKQKGTKNEI